MTYVCEAVPPGLVVENLSTSMTVFLAPAQPPPSKDPNCPDCLGHGEIVWMYDRPGGPPGNMVVPCGTCRRST